MPQGVSGLFSGIGGAGTSASSYVGAASRGSQDSTDPSTSFDDVLDRTRNGGGSIEQASDRPKTQDASTNATSKKSAPSRTAKKKPAASDPAQPRTVKAPKKDPTAEAEQNASSNAGSEDAEPNPDAGDESSKLEKPQKKAEATAAPAVETPAAIVQVQNPPSPEQATDAKPAPKDESPARQAAAKVTPASGQQAPAAEDPTPAPAAPGDTTTQQSPGDSPASSDGQPDSATPDLAIPQGKVRLAIQPKDANAAGNADPAQASAAAAAVQQAAGQAAAGDSTTSDAPTSPNAVASTPASSPAPRTNAKSPDDLLLQAFGGAQQPAHAPASNSVASPGATADAAPVSPTAQFAQANHANVVSGITGRLLPGGGSMQIRLDPPELGAMQVRVEMRNGVMTATFETSSDQATKLLSHSLGDLKTALEAQGVSVERLHVSQAPKQQDSSSSGNGQKGDSQPRQDTAAQQEQQRREMMQRMWRRLMKGQDPLDLVA